jgi:hypothetical protein
LLHSLARLHGSAARAGASCTNERAAVSIEANECSVATEEECEEGRAQTSECDDVAPIIELCHCVSKA